VADIDFMGFKAKAYCTQEPTNNWYSTQFVYIVNGKLEYYPNQQITADNNLDRNE
jgi:hypothetical protein